MKQYDGDEDQLTPNRKNRPIKDSVKDDRTTERKKIKKTPGVIQVQLGAPPVERSVTQKILQVTRPIQLKVSPPLVTSAYLN